MKLRHRRPASINIQVFSCIMSKKKNKKKQAKKERQRKRITGK